jgi:hypothetical protein
MRDAPGLARVVDDRERQARLLFEHGEGEAHHGGSRITPPIGNPGARNPLTAVNPNSEPRPDAQGLDTLFSAADVDEQNVRHIEQERRIWPMRFLP